MVQLHEIREGTDPRYVGCGVMTLSNCAPNLSAIVIVPQDDNAATWQWFKRAVFDRKDVVLQITEVGGSAITGPFHLTIAAGVAKLESAGTLTEEKKRG